jgi:hypothetical protein
MRFATRGPLRSLLVKLSAFVPEEVQLLTKTQTDDASHKEYPGVSRRLQGAEQERQDDESKARLRVAFRSRSPKPA